MDVDTKKALLFWIGCIGTRVGMTWLAATHQKLLPYMGVIAAMISLGFAVIYFGGLRETGAEVFGGRIWWNSLRPIHSALYGLFAYAALHGTPDAWRFLAVDVSVGILAKLTH